MTPPLSKTKTPGVFKRGDRYVVVWRHRGKQHKQFFRTYAEAREAKGKRTGGESAPATKQRFDLYARGWLEAYQGRTARGLDEDTREGYRRALEAHAIPHLGTLALRDIGRADLDQLIAALARKGLSARSIAAYVAPVRAMFADALERGDISANPATRLRINAKVMAPRRSGKPPRRKDMTRAELSALLSAVPEGQNEGRDRLLFELLAHTGCRISEALGLDWSDVSRDGRSLRIERQWYRGTLKPYTKSANGMRTISLSPGLAGRLQERRAEPSAPIFHTRTGLRLSDRNVGRILERAVASADVPRVSPHSFRHTHGSMLLDEGWPITDVAHRLGDDVQTIARTYAHKLRDSDRDLGFLDELTA
jgi:integrase